MLLVTLSCPSLKIVLSILIKCENYDGQEYRDLIKYLMMHLVEALKKKKWQQ